MSIIDVTYPAWMDTAACADSDADFFPGPGQNVGPARAVCRDCPARMACLTWALEQHIGNGVFGGLTGSERARLGPRAYPCPDCGHMLRSEAGLPLHLKRWCQGVAA